MKTTLRALALATAGGAIIALSLSGVARAVTDTVFRYSTPKTGWLMIGPAALIPESGSTVDWNSSGGTAMQGTTAAEVCLQAPVNLPQGAKMTTFVIWYSRMNSGAFFSYVFFRRHVPQQTGASIVNKDAAATGGTLRQATTLISDTTLQTVGNHLYHYRIRVCLNQGGVFYGARISYTYATAGD